MELSNTTKGKWQRNRRYERLEWLKKYKEDKCCIKCSWNKYTHILEFHHRDKETKKFSFSTGNIGNYSIETILKEINKCDLLCPNCHNKIHFIENQTGVIKHQRVSTNKRTLYIRKKRNERMKWLREYKLDKKCNICGWNDFTPILEFHNKNNITNKLTLSHCNIGSISFDRILDKINNSDILCSNCGNLKNYKERSILNNS